MKGGHESSVATIVQLQLPLFAVGPPLFALAERRHRLAIRDDSSFNLMQGSEGFDTLPDLGRDELHKQIDAHIETNRQLAAQYWQLQSARGFAPQVACRLMAFMPELGHVDRRQIASLAGLGPHARESDLYKGKHTIHGGRSHVSVQCTWLLLLPSDGISSGSWFIRPSATCPDFALPRPSRSLQ